MSYIRARKKVELLEWLLMGILGIILSAIVSEAMAASYEIHTKDGQVITKPDQASAVRFMLMNESKVSKVYETHEVELNDKLRFVKQRANR